MTIDAVCVTMTLVLAVCLIPTWVKLQQCKKDYRDLKGRFALYSKMTRGKRR